MEESAESKDVQIKKLEATVKSLSEELIKVGGRRRQSRTNRKFGFFQTQLGMPDGWCILIKPSCLST